MKNSTGIYQIKNVINNKIYIGSSVDIEGRIYKHKRDLINNKHHNTHLQNAWNKYGEDVFLFEILQSNVEHENLRSLEQYYLDNYKSYCPELGYNIAKSTSATMLDRNHTEETKQLISEISKNTIRNESLNITPNDDILISQCDIERILNIKEKNAKIIFLTLLIQHKIYPTTTGVFHMTFKEMHKFTGLDMKTCSNNVKKLEKINVVNVIRGHAVCYNGRIRKDKNRYKILIDMEYSTSDNIKYFKLKTNNYIHFFYFCLCEMYNEQELRMILPRKQYNHVAKFKKEYNFKDEIAEIIHTQPIN